MRRPHFPAAALSTLLFVMLTVSCSGIGPSTVNNDRLDYVNAISESWKEQMLLNMVKVRYGDVPVFLDVSSVIAQYSVETQLDARLTWEHPSKNTQALGGSAKYTDRPTVTYNPLAGEKFARSMMTPIRPSAIMSLIQAGYPVDLVLRFCAHSINGIRNDYGGPARAHTADQEFYPLLAALRRIQAAGALGFRVKKGEGDRDIIVTFPRKVEADIRRDIEFALGALQLEPGAREYAIGYGLVPQDRHEIAILSRSVFDILVDTASHIEVPEKHVSENRVGATRTVSAPENSVLFRLMRVQSGESKPSDALVAVPYRGHWFWIDDRDPFSKRLFSFLMFILALTETGDRGATPLVTIPTG